MNKSILYTIIILLLFSCKKDRLSGDRDKLVGKWKWVKTEYQPSLTSPFYIYNSSTNSGEVYQIELKKCGKFYFSLETSIQVKSRTNFGSDNNCGDSNPCTHIIYLIDNNNLQMNLYLIGEDTLVTTRYPYNFYTDTDGYIKDYRNVYVRE